MLNVFEGQPGHHVDEGDMEKKQPAQWTGLGPLGPSDFILSMIGSHQEVLIRGIT